MTDTSPHDGSFRVDGIPAAEDSHHHVNATRLAAYPIPAEHPMRGAYIELDHRNRELTRRLLGLHEKQANLLDPENLARIGSAVAANLKTPVRQAMSPQAPGALQSAAAPGSAEAPSSPSSAAEGSQSADPGI